jgi:hypothetical protein
MSGSTTFTLTVVPLPYIPPIGKPPVFRGEGRVNDTEVKVNTLKVLTVPPYYDPDGDSVTMLLMYHNTTTLPVFMSFSDRYITIRPCVLDIGDYDITVVLIDNKFQVSAYEFKVTVYNPLSRVNLPPVITDPGKDSQDNVTFDNSQFIDKFSRNTLKAKIVSISMKGQVLVKFSDAILVPANWSSINVTALKITCDDRPADFILYWNFTGFETWAIGLQLTFKDPLEVSSGNIKDMLNIQFIENTWFKEADTAVPINYMTTLKGQLPP